MASLGSYIKRENLPTDLVGRMDALTLNAGSNFLAGKVTSAFSPVKNIIDNSVVAVNTSKDMINRISKELIEHSLSIIQNRIQSYISEKTTELLSFDNMIANLTQSIAYHTQQNLETPGEILQSLMTKDSEKETQKFIDQAKDNGINQIKSNINETIGNINKFVDTTIGSLDSGVESITAYITNGTDWVISTVNSYVGMIINKAETFIGTHANNAIKFRDDNISALGESIGLAAANKINNLARNVAKKKKSDLEDKISKVQTKAMNSLTKAFMVVRQLTGIAIPPVYPKLPKLTSLF